MKNKFKILFVTNIPVPYRIDFFNELGKYVDLTVVFEAKTAKNIVFNWNLDKISNFKAIFLSQGEIKEKSINFLILKCISRKYDKVILTNYAYFTELIAYLYFIFLRKKFSIEVDGGYIRSEKLFIRMVKKFLISNASSYYSPSLKTDEYLVHYGAKLESIIRYPFTSLTIHDLESNASSLKSKFFLRNEMGFKNEIIILGIGQFIHRKGFDLLLNASNDFDKNIKIIIIGGESSEMYLKYIENSNFKNINFISFQSKELLKNYFIISDIFVIPSREEIWGLVVNEAMSFGLPIVSSNSVIASNELIEDGVNGLLFENENIVDLKSKIQELIKNPELRESIMKNNLEKIKKYTIEEMVNVHLESLNNNK